MCVIIKRLLVSSLGASSKALGAVLTGLETTEQGGCTLISGLCIAPLIKLHAVAWGS